MELSLSINLPNPVTTSKSNSLQDPNKTGRRKSALKSARAAAKAQLKMEGEAANEDDIRVAKPPGSE